MARNIKLAAVLLTAAAYPFLGTFLIQAGWSDAVLVLFAAMTASRSWRATQSGARLAYGFAAVVLLGGAALAESVTIRLIPAVVYLSLASVFGYTLRHPPSLVERIVRLEFPEFKPGIAEYLRQITWLWTGFFAANVGICSALAMLADDRAWSIYTGLVVYLLMGTLAVGEYLYRPRRFPELEIPRPLASLKVMVRNGHRIFGEFR